MDVTAHRPKTATKDRAGEAPFHAVPSAISVPPRPVGAAERRLPSQRRRPFTTPPPQARLSFSIEVELIDSSLAGVGVETSAWLEVGRRYTFRMGAGGRSFEASARVAWCRLIGTRPRAGDVLPIYRAGLELGRPWPHLGARPFDRSRSP